ILYHWRIIDGSIAADIAAKDYVADASKRVREDALRRREAPGRVEPVAGYPGYFQTYYDLAQSPKISIIIPSRDNESILRRCISSILNCSSYQLFEVLIIDNGSIESVTATYLCEVVGMDSRIRVLRH